MKTTLLYSLLLAAMMPAEATEFQIEPIEHDPLFRGKAQPFDR